MTDGHLRENKYGYTLALELQEKDKIVLDNFIKIINGDLNQIKKRKKSNSVRIQVSSKKIVKDLNKKGIPCGSKSFTLQFPKIKKEFLSHFVRGCIEGDGSISLKRTHRKTYDYHILGLDFYGTKNMCDGICSTLGYKNNTKSFKNIYRFNKGISSSSNILKLYNYLYQDCGEHYLPRKREKLAEIYKERVQWENLQMMKKSKVEVICV